MVNRLNKLHVVILSLIILGLVIFLGVSDKPMDSYDLTSTWEKGGDMSGAKVKFEVTDMGRNPMAGEYLWEDRNDVSYVTFDSIELYNVGVGDVVIVTVNDILKIANIYMIIIEDYEVVTP